MMDSVNEMPPEQARRRPRAAIEAERQLQGQRVAGVKFHRQQRIGPDLAALCCLQPRLIIELDGGQDAE